MKPLGTIIWLLSSISAVNAVNPHFVKATAQLSSSGDLDVSWTEAGLGSGETINYEVTASASATYACFNKGNKNPQATNKRTTTASISQSAPFTANKSGNIVGQTTIFHLSPPSDFSCPGGQTERLADVSYTNVVVTDPTNGVSQPIAGTFQKTFITLTK
jgi:hypothetical protein